MCPDREVLSLERSSTSRVASRVGNPFSHDLGTQPSHQHTKRHSKNTSYLSITSFARFPALSCTFLSKGG